MKKQILIFTAVVCGMTCTTTAYAQFKIGGKKINVGKVVQAGTDAAKAITLSDADIAAMSREYMQWMDTHNPLTKPDTEYGKRLEKLTGHIKEVDGLKVNFGVYEVVDVNAFACGDGSVRICAGLMDIMTDDEVMAVVGHEIGHVIHTDSKDAMKSAYLRSAVKNAAGAASSTVSKLTDSELGAMAEALAGAQYSQKQETEADIMKGHGFSVFDNAAYIGGICAEGAASYTRKQLDALTEFVKKPQIGAKGMVYARVEADGTVKSSVDKFYTQEVLQEMKAAFGAKPGDLILILSGDDVMKTRKQLNELRLEMGNQLGLRDKNKFALLWIVDFPMFEWSEEEGRLMAMHHPFTHPKDEDIPLLDTDPAAVRADAYDMVCNGIEVGGGSIRIHDAQLQAKMFEILGFTPEKAEEQFGFLMNAFKFGAPPHGGLAYGLDRWVSIFAGLDSIRDCIAFPKNNSGRDVMLDAPSVIDQKQLDELNLIVEVKE